MLILLKNLSAQKATVENTTQSVQPLQKDRAQSILEGYLLDYISWIFRGFSAESNV